jgi:choline dehydrogenase-like flavoprotein
MGRYRFDGTATVSSPMSWLAASRQLEESGFPLIADANEPGAVGLACIPVNARDGERISTALAYLPLGQGRSNLTIRCEAEVSGADLGWRPRSWRAAALGRGDPSS